MSLVRVAQPCCLGLLPSILLIALAGTLGGGEVWAGEVGVPIEVILKDHHFTPAEIPVTARQATVLRITNQDQEPEEFEMRQLAIERVILPGGTAEVRLRPLGPGRYNFIGEFHSDSAQGTIVAE